MTDYPVRSSGSASGSGSADRSGGGGSASAAGGSRSDQLQEKLVGGFNKLLDGVEPHLDRVPEGAREPARRAVSFARERPLLTMAGLALGAVMLLGSGRRRH